MTLTKFLTARLDEDEALARAMTTAVWPEQVRVAPRLDTGDAPEGQVAMNDPTYGKAWTMIWSSGVHEDKWHPHPKSVEVYGPDVAARVLREVEAKRAIVASHQWYVDTADRDFAYTRAGEADLAERHVKDLAAVYSDHPDYREEWRP